MTYEEEQDRKKLLMTRRRFLFLGAAAAGAAILTPIIPEIGAGVSYNVRFTVGPPPFIVSPLVGYYDKTFLQTLKAATPFLEMAKTRPIPAVEQLERKIYFYA
jgi:hypothetical protein